MKEKRLELCTRVIKIAISSIGVILLIGWLLAPGYWTKPLSYLVTIALPYLPNLLAVAKVKVSPALILAYEIFLVASMVLGIDLDWYRTMLVTATGDSYFDKIIHCLSGALVAVAAQEIYALQQQGSKQSKKAWFQWLFLLGMVALMALVWECYEFAYDQIFGGHMQELVKAGLADTMWDMITALMGGIIATRIITWQS